MKNKNWAKNTARALTITLGLGLGAVPALGSEQDTAKAESPKVSISSGVHHETGRGPLDKGCYLNPTVKIGDTTLRALIPMQDVGNTSTNTKLTAILKISLPTENKSLKGLTPGQISTTIRADGSKLGIMPVWNRPQIPGVLGKVLPNKVGLDFYPRENEKLSTSIYGFWFPDIQKSRDENWSSLLAKSFLVPEVIIASHGIKKTHIGDTKIDCMKLFFVEGVFSFKALKEKIGPFSIIMPDEAIASFTRRGKVEAAGVRWNVLEF